VTAAKKPKFDPRFIPPAPLRRKVSFEHCDRCGVLVGRGLDYDVMAMSVRVDPMFISLFGEAQILKLSMAVGTFDLEQRRLYRRDEWDRRARPAGAIWPVLAEHLCWIPFPETWRQRERVPLVKPYPNYAEPPF
jgi:hypothetical protein